MKQERIFYAVMFISIIGFLPAFGTDFNAYLRRAQMGDIPAMHQVGYMYHTGEGVAQNYAEAYYWYRRAAEDGFSISQNNLGCLYEDGLGVEKDYEQAMYWYRKAAESGDENGLFNVGWMYENGYGVEQDKAEAYFWYRRAAEKNLPIAEFRIGLFYLQGKAVLQNREKAIEWFQKSASHGFTDAIDALTDLGVAAEVAVETVDEVVTEIQEPYTSPDLKWKRVQGHIKVIYETQRYDDEAQYAGDTETIRFDISGKWIPNNPKNVRVTRNDAGQIVKIVQSDHIEGTTYVTTKKYTYNSVGDVITETLEQTDGGGKSTFWMNEDGWILTEKHESYEAGGFTVITNYSYYDLDEYGNWTRAVRKEKYVSSEFPTEIRASTITRKFVYWE